MCWQIFIKWLLSAENRTEIHCVYTGQLVKSAAEKSLFSVTLSRLDRVTESKMYPFQPCFQMHFPFLSSLQIAVCTMAVSAGFLGKEQSVQIWKATCEKTSNHLQLNSLCQSGCLHARLGQQGSTQCLNASCQVLINCLGIFILNLFVYQTQLNLKVRDLDTEGFILALICPDTGQFLFSVSAFFWCV